MTKRLGIWLALLLCCTVGAFAEDDAKILRVGVFPMEPLNYMDQDNVAQGFNPDLLRRISQERDRWRPEFVPVTWAEGLEKLQTEELDLMMSVTYTDKRAEVMDYCVEPILEVWSQIFVRPGTEIESALDLHQRIVGVMKRGIHGRNFTNLADAFGIDYELVEYDTHREIFEALERGEIDAGVAPNHFGLRHARRYDLVGTAIQFSPAPVYFSTKKGRLADVLADIDSVLGEWREDQNSYYFWRFDYWFGAEHRWGEDIPIWVKLVFGVAVLSSISFLVLSWWFRREVKQRTRLLEESGNRLQEAQRIARLGRWDMDFATGKVEWSDGMYEILDLDPKEEAGHYNDIMKFVYSEDREMLDTAFKESVEKHERYELQHRIILKDGTVKWVHESGECEYDSAGKPIRAYGTTQDISDQVEATLAYKKSSERLRLATKAGQVGVWEYDFAYDNLIWDDMMFKIYGVDRASFDGKFHSWEHSVHPDDLEKTREEFSHAVRDGAPFEAEFRIVTKRLQVKHIRALAEVEYDRRGEPSRVIGMNWDVTPHRQMVAALTASEQDYRNLFENMTTGFVLFEVLKNSSGVPVDFRFAQLNESARKMADRDRMELIGQSLKEVFQPLEEYWIDVLAKVAMTGQASSYENRMESIGRYLSIWIFVPKPGFLGVVVTDTTARRMAEDAMHAAQQQLQLIFDNTNDVIFKTDAQGNYSYLNSAAEELTGFPIPELLGKNILDLVSPELREEMAARLQTRLQGEDDPHGFYFEMSHRDGHKIVLEIVTTVMRDAEGNLEEIHGIARDATERKKAEKELEESRRFLRSIIDTIPARVFWKDRDSVYLGCNRAFAADAGVEHPDDLVGKTDYDLSWSGSEADLYRKDDQEIMTLELERINYEEPQTRPDGTQFWLSTSKVPIRDVDGRVIGVLGAYQDITLRKALEEERSRLTTAINQSAEAIVIMDLEGYIQYVNPAFSSVTGYEPQEAVGQNLAIIKSGKHDDMFYSNIWKTIESGESWNGRIINKRKDGVFYTAESAISPVKDPGGAIEHYVVAIRDVSEQVELEQHVRQAQKMDAVGRLAGGVAHDFNNILQSILGFSGILMSELEEGSSQYEDVSEIRKAARRAGDLTRQLLTLSRKHNVEYSLQNLNEIISRNEKMMRRLIGEHIEFVFDFDPGLKTVRADLSQIEQIILNLFINARDAMPEGGRLTVRTTNVEVEPADASDSGQICLEVQDTGHGIREDVKQHLFEPFFTTKQVGEGTGLGLSVVYGIVQQHGGHIEVSSRVGEGALFKVFLPICTEEPEPMLVDENKPRDARSLEGHGERVLVLEDDTVVRELSCRMLKDAGYDVKSAASVQDARTFMESDCCDLMMADMVLPDGNGLELAQELKGLRTDLRVLICSGYSQDPDVLDVIRKNNFRYLEKPVGSMQLLQTVREMLDESRVV